MLSVHLRIMKKTVEEDLWHQTLALILIQIFGLKKKEPKEADNRLPQGDYNG